MVPSALPSNIVTVQYTVYTVQQCTAGPSALPSNIVTDADVSAQNLPEGTELGHQLHITHSNI